MVWMVSRTRSVSSKVSIGSSARPGRSPAVSIGSPNSMCHLLGSGTSPSGPSHGNVGVIGKYGRPRTRASVLALTEHRMDLLGAHDRHRDDRDAGAQRRRDEPAPSEALQLVPLAERLADALEPLGPDADELAVAEQPFGVGRGRPACCRSCARTGRGPASRRPGRRRACAGSGAPGSSSWTATAVITPSSAQIAPAWLATSSAPPSAGMFSTPCTSVRNQLSYSGRSAGTATWSVRSGSKPNSSTA